MVDNTNGPDLSMSEAFCVAQPSEEFHVSGWSVEKMRQNGILKLSTGRAAVIQQYRVYHQNSLEYDAAKGDIFRLLLGQTPNIVLTEQITIAAAKTFRWRVGCDTHAFYIHSAFAYFQRRHIGCSSEYT